MQATRQRGILAMLVVVVALSLGSTMVKKSGLPGPTAAFWRLLIGMVIWHTIVFVHGVRTGQRRYLSRDALKLTFLPGAAFGINLAFFFTSLTKTSITHTEFIGALTPILVVPIAKKQLGERVPKAILGFAALAFVGVAIIIFSGVAKGKTSAPASASGDVLVLGAVALWAVYLLRSKTVRSRVTTIEFMAGMTTCALLALTPVALVRAGSLGALADVSRIGWTMIGLMSISSGLLAHGLMVWAQRTVPVSTISIMQVAQPGFASFWAWLFLNQAVSGRQIIGMIIVMFAIGNVAWQSSTGSASHQTTSPDVPPDLPAEVLAKRSL